MAKDATISHGEGPDSSGLPPQISDIETLRKVWPQLELILWKAAMSMCLDEQLALDAVHDTFLRVYRMIKAGVTVPSEEASTSVELRKYLSKTVRNRLIDLLRSESKREASKMKIALRLKTTRPRLVFDPVEKVDLLSWIRENINNLPPRQRQIMSIRLTEDSTHDEIAKLLGISRATVTQCIIAACQTLRQRALSLPPNEMWSGLAKLRRHASAREIQNDMIHEISKELLR